MTEPLSTTEMGTVNVEFALPSQSLSDMTGMADAAVTKALEFCAQKMGLHGPQAVIDRLRQGDSTACGYFHYGLAEQVAKHLAEFDEDVKTVYLYSYDATPEDVCFGEATPASQVHLIIWAQRKTAALNSLVNALDRALVEGYGTMIGTPQLMHLLDVQIIDDDDVKRRVGYGALLSSLHLPPIEIWRR
ncbi:MAG: hypothetical protein H5T64_11085 [Chloroflexi bacterium]|nr:hypothetical protein [Chloroflexota bacterium]